ncbi:hypothetical protein TURU_107361 [Turdus rufiventris]|nr:hypothetical protein TURU_107361 [Turdus rufiventris]
MTEGTEDVHPLKFAILQAIKGKIVSGKDLCISHIIAVEEKLSSGTQHLFKSLYQQYPNCNNAKNPGEQNENYYSRL